MSNITIPEFAATLKHDVSALVERMTADRILQPTGRPYREHARRGYFDVAGLSSRAPEITLTGKGQIWLARKYPPKSRLGAQA